MKTHFLVILIVSIVLTSCAGPSPDDLPLTAVAGPGGVSSEWQPVATRVPTHTPVPTQTPSPPTATPDALAAAQGMPGPDLILPAFTFSPDDLVLLNGVLVTDVLHVDTTEWVLVENTAPALKLIPDSELVYGPAYTSFSIEEYVNRHEGYLKYYREKVDGQLLSGAQVVDYVARQYSVGPRVLLALLEYYSGWVAQPVPDWLAQSFPLGNANSDWRGLYAQVTWAANRLNYGYYGRKYRGLRTVRFSNNTFTYVPDELNDGTVAVQTVLGLYSTFEPWKKAVGPSGFWATYRRLFGDPFAHDLGNTLPRDLEQPPLELPWAVGETWFYSGGPHGGWGGGSAAAAIDFVPPGSQSGCYDTDAWLTAAAPGVVARSQYGVVVLDLDGDGLEQTGWVLNYSHSATRDRIAAGTRVKTGDKLSHPSCESGVSTGTHVHFARRYNGEWIPAGAGRLPMVLSGWTVQQGGAAYDGTLVKGPKTLTAIAGRAENYNDVLHVRE
jgi:murein DD-endopeptidase MepM/ murein hydrolase activator NlpD